MDNSTISFIRRSNDPFDFLVFAINFTPVPREGYLLGVPELCYYEEIFNSDSGKYCGSNTGNGGGVSARQQGAFQYHNSITVTIPPLGGIILKPKYEEKKAAPPKKKITSKKKTGAKPKAASKKTAAKKV